MVSVSHKGLIQLILKKVQKGKDLNVIAEELEETEENLVELYEIIKNNPGKTREEIYYIYHASIVS